MNANDLERKVGRQMAELGSISSFVPLTIEDKQKVMVDFEIAIMDYTSEKVLEAGIQDDLVLDLGFMFDKIDTCFQSTTEKEKFYEKYVFAMLNIHNNIEKDSVLWSPSQELDITKTYPRFSKLGEYINIFETNIQESNKENALWLYDHLTKKYKNEKSYIKK